MTTTTTALVVPHSWELRCLQGPEWMESLDKSFGYLGKEGYCYNGKCHVFPIAVGECEPAAAPAVHSSQNSSLVRRAELQLSPNNSSGSCSCMPYLQ
jgi:hypothetical protein